MAVMSCISLALCIALAIVSYFLIQSATRCENYKKVIGAQCSDIERLDATKTANEDKISDLSNKLVLVCAESKRQEAELVEMREELQSAKNAHKSTLKELEKEREDREILAKQRGAEMVEEEKSKFLLKLDELSIKEKRADEAIKKAEDDSKKLEQEYNELKADLQRQTEEERKTALDELQKVVQDIDNGLGEKIAEITMMNTLAFNCTCSSDLIPCSIDFTKENFFRCPKCGNTYRVGLRAEPILIDRTASEAEFQSLINKKLEEYGENA